MAVFALLIAFVIRFINQEKFIYFWDYVQYHGLYKELGPRFELSPFRAWHFVLNSIRGSDYNSLPVVFLMPFRIAFGPGRLAYVLSIAVTFIFPAIVLFSILIRRLPSRDAPQNLFDEAGVTILSILALAPLPLLWSPVVIGSVDSGGLVIMFSVLLIYFSRDFTEQTLGRLLSIAFLLSLLVLYRRWYAYWVVGFFGAIVLCEAIRCANNGERRRKCLLILMNTLKIGVVSLLSFVAIATPIARKMLSTNYRDIYSAYRSGSPVLHNLKSLYEHFGLLTLVLVGLGIVISVRNPIRRPIVNFLCIQFVITFFLFTRTQDFTVQDMGIQHFYWVVATFAILAAFFLQDTFVWLKTRTSKLVFLVAILALSLGNFCVTFFPAANDLLRPVAFALPSVRQYPKLRSDLDQVQALLNTLNDLSGKSESMIYILSSSFTLNSSIVSEACFQLPVAHPAMAHKIASTSDIDKRDGFPLQFLKAQFVVVTVPFGFHLAPQDQRVIGILADQLVKVEGIGKSYERLNLEFRLEDGSSALIYRKARPLDPGAVTALSDLFMKFYPDDKYKFEIPMQLVNEASTL